MLEEEIKQKRAILQSTNVDIQTLNEYKKLKEELNAQGLSIEEPRILLSILKTTTQIGYDPQKIVRELLRMKSLRQTERQLNNCRKDLQARLDRYREVLPLCEQIVGLRIGIGELLAFDTAVYEKAEAHNLPRDRVAYYVTEDIRDYDKLGGMKKKLKDISMQIFMMNQYLGRQKYAVNALMKLHFYGITENQILSLCNTIETNGAQSTNSHSFSSF